MKRGRQVYLPKSFENVDVERSLGLMRAAPLATIISVDEEQHPFISHLPLIAEQVGNRLVLVGHLARANAHSQLLGGAEATAIFHGPNAYITPTWYTENNVPTWNYAVVHARGRVALIQDRAGIVRCLEKLTAVVESAGGWQFWIPDDLATTLERHIVGFELEVDGLSAKFKVSQNRSSADRAGVIRGLEARPDAGSHGVLALMRELEASDDESATV